MVDADHLIDVLHPANLIVIARMRSAAVNLPRQRAIQDIVHQRRLAAARDARDHREEPQRNLDLDILQIVMPRPHHRDLVLAGVPPHLGRWNLLHAGEILPGQRPRILRDLQRRALGHQVSAQPPRARPQIHHVIGALDGLGVVLHHQHRVPHVAQVRQGFE